MKKPIRIPSALVFVALGGATIAGVMSSSSCHDDRAPTQADAGTDAVACEVRCFPASPDAGTVCTFCADAGNCPTGCVAEPIT